MFELLSLESRRLRRSAIPGQAPGPGRHGIGRLPGRSLPAVSPMQQRRLPGGACSSIRRCSRNRREVSSSRCRLLMRSIPSSPSRAGPSGSHTITISSRGGKRSLPGFAGSAGRCLRRIGMFRRAGSQKKKKQRDRAGCLKGKGGSIRMPFIARPRMEDIDTRRPGDITAPEHKRPATRRLPSPA